MTYWIKVVMLVMSSNMDDFGFGLAMGFKEKVSWWVAAIIGLMSGVTMGVGMVLGQFATGFLTSESERTVSTLIYFLMAIWFALDELRTHPTAAENQEKNNRRWTPFSALIVGIALGVDSFFLGISAGLLKMPLWFTAGFAGISSFLLIFGGSALAQRIAKRLPQMHFGLISAGLLALLALMNFL